MIMLDITLPHYETLESTPTRHMSPQSFKARATWFDLWVPHMMRIASEMLSHGPWRVRVCICTCARGSVYTGNQLDNQKNIS